MNVLSAIKIVCAEIIVLLLIFGCSALYYLEVAALPSRTLNLLLIQPVFVVITMCTFALIFLKLRDSYMRMHNSEESSLTNASIIEQASASASASIIANTTAHRTFVKNSISFGICTLLYVILLDKLGFVLTSFLYLSVLIYLLGSRSLWLTFVLPVAVVAFLYVTMVVMLKFSLPAGFLV